MAQRGRGCLEVGMCSCRRIVPCARGWPCVFWTRSSQPPVVPRWCVQYMSNDRNSRSCLTDAFAGLFGRPSYSRAMGQRGYSHVPRYGPGADISQDKLKFYSCLFLPRPKRSMLRIAENVVKIEDSCLLLIKLNESCVLDHIRSAYHRIDLFGFL